jgi:hypothetical protein
MELTINNIGQYVILNSNLYHQCYVENKPGTNDRERPIGLFFIRIDENKLKFNLANYKENRVCFDKIKYSTYLIFVCIRT